MSAIAANPRTVTSRPQVVKEMVLARRKPDYWILAAVVGLCLIGIVMVYSASYAQSLAENPGGKGAVYALKQVQNLLFKKNEQQVNNKLAKKADKKYRETGEEIKAGMKVKMKKNHQIGEVKEIRGRRAIVQIGMLPMNVELADLIAVEEKQPAE